MYYHQEGAWISFYGIISPFKLYIFLETFHQTEQHCALWIRCAVVFWNTINHLIDNRQCEMYNMS